CPRPLRPSRSSAGRAGRVSVLRFSFVPAIRRPWTCPPPFDTTFEMSRHSVILGMSGGVDSSVAAALLVEQGYDVHGVTLQVWEHEDEQVAVTKRWQDRGCCKVGLARHVAKRLGIPHELIDTRDIFRANVINDFVSGYVQGTTPNPCVRCNERVKLRSLVLLAEARGIEFVATGHYARVVEHRGGHALCRAHDARKDQTYFLYRLQRP